jgi:uncharacterized lipoprotein YddW (UPF0748 family)
MIKLRRKPVDINIIQVYAPTAESTEEEVNTFYNNINEAIKQCKKFEVTLVMGYLNAKVGQEQDNEVTDGLGLVMRGGKCLSIGPDRIT